MGTREIVKLLETSSKLINDGVIETEVNGKTRKYRLNDKEKALLALNAAAKLLYVVGAPADLGRITDDVQKILEERFKKTPTTFKPMSARERKNLGMD